MNMTFYLEWLASNSIVTDGVHAFNKKIKNLSSSGSLCICVCLCVCLLLCLFNIISLSLIAFDCLLLFLFNRISLIAFDFALMFFLFLFF